MSKLLRTILKIAGALVALMLLVTVVLMVLINPDKHRVAIEEAFLAATGLQLDIAGDMELSYQPYVGVMLNDVRLRNPTRPQELASASLISLRVNPRELLGGRLLVEELHADGLHLNYYVDANGDSLWLTERLRQPPAREAAVGDMEGSQVSVRLDFVTVASASIDIQNLQRGYYYSIRDLDLNSQDTNLAGRPFALQATFELIDPTAPEPWALTLTSNNRIDRQSGELTASNIQLGLTPALLQGEVVVRDLYNAVSWQAQFSSSEFAFDDLLDNLFGREELEGEPSLPGMRRDPAWQTQWQVSLRGDTQGIEMPELVATLGDLRLQMNGDIRFANGLLPANGRFNIETGALDLSPYLSGADQPAPPAAVGEEPAEEDTQDPVNRLYRLTIPDSLKSGMNVQGSITLGSLFMGGVQFGTINLFTNLESGVLDVELQPTAVMDGSLEGHLRINTISARNQISTEFFATDINLANLDLPLLVPGTITGRLSQESRYAGTGSTLGDWLETVSGATSFSVADSSVDIGIIKQVFTAIAVLSPRGEAIQSWPDEIRFNQFSGYAILEDGLDANQQVKLRLDNFDITGTGGVDLTGQRFDYNLLFTVLGEPFLQTIPVSTSYLNVSWPVECSAGFEEPVNRLCRPDLAQVREIFSQLANSDLQYRLDEVLDEQVPPALQNSTRGLLQQLFPEQNASSNQDETTDQNLIPGQDTPPEPEIL